MSSHIGGIDLSHVLSPAAQHVVQCVHDPKALKALMAVLRPLAVLADPGTDRALDGVTPSDQKAIVALLRPGHPDGSGKLVHPDFSLHVLKGDRLKATAAALAARLHGERVPMAAPAAPATPLRAAPRSHMSMDPMMEGDRVRAVGNEARADLQRARSALHARKRPATAPRRDPAAGLQEAHQEASMLGNIISGSAAAVAAGATALFGGGSRGDAPAPAEAPDRAALIREQDEAFRQAEAQDRARLQQRRAAERRAAERRAAEQVRPAVAAARAFQACADAATPLPGHHRYTAGDIYYCTTYRNVFRLTRVRGATKDGIVLADLDEEASPGDDYSSTVAKSTLRLCAPADVERAQSALAAGGPC